MFVISWVNYLQLRSYKNRPRLTTPRARPRVSRSVIARLGRGDLECAAGDAGRLIATALKVESRAWGEPGRAIRLPWLA